MWALLAVTQSALAADETGLHSTNYVSSAVSERPNALARRVVFDIVAQDLAQAIVVFGEQADIVIVGRSANLARHQAPAVVGEYIVGDALTTLLASSGIDYDVLPPNGVVLSKPAPAPIHTNPIASDADDSVRELEEITVIANRRDTRLQKTPIAVTSLDQYVLTENDVSELSELTEFVPSLIISTSVTDQTDTNLTIRGVGAVFSTEVADQMVGVYVDGVYSVRPQGALSSVYDLERVEVLRGPQGTMFGRNSIAGSVLLQTKKPTDELEAELQMSFGNYNRRQISSALNLPVNDAIAFRLATYTDTADGWVTQLNSDGSTVNNVGLIVEGAQVDIVQPLNNVSMHSTRVTGLFHLRDDLRWSLAFERMDNNSSGSVLLDPSKIERGDFSAFIDTPQTLDLTNKQWRSVLTWDLPEVSVDYLASFSELRRRQQVDLDAAAGDEVWINNTHWQRSDGFSHELKLVSRGGKGVQWTAGAFWFEEKTDLNFDMYFSGGGFDARFIQPARGTRSSALYGQLAIGLSEALTLSMGARHTKDEKYDDGGRTYFNCKGVDIAPNRALGSDLLVYEDFQDNASGAFLAGGDGRDDTTGAVFSYDRCLLSSTNDAKKGSNDTSGLLRLTYDAGGPLIYGSVSSAYQAGLILDGVYGKRGGDVTGGDKLISYELGVKTSTPRLRMSAASFYLDYQNTSRSIVDEVNETLHFGDVSAQVSGIELELKWLVGHSGTFDFAGSWLQSRYGDYSTFGGICGVGENNPKDSRGLCNLKGNQLPRTPEISFSAGFHWVAELSSASITPRILFNYSDSVFFEDANDGAAPINSVYAGTPQSGISDSNPIGQGAYLKADIGMSYEPYNSYWRIDMYVNNVTNEMTKYGANSAIITERGGLARYNPPRTFGMRINASF